MGGVRFDVFAHDTSEVMIVPKSKKKNKVEKPTNPANLSQNMDKREKVGKDMNHLHGHNPK